MFGTIFIVVAVVAAFSLGIAFILDTQATKLRWQRRAFYAAFAGATIPALLPITILLLTEGGDPEIWIVLITLLIVALILAAVVGFPITYWFCKRREAARHPPQPEKVFE